jgi:hypothetical protein
MTKAQTKYYLSPYSGRVIKSSGRLYKQLKQIGVKVDKQTCFYNHTSAKRCLNRIFKRYPGLIRPPSNFYRLPRTLKESSFSGFVTNENGDNVIGAVTRQGEIKKTKTPVSIPITMQLPIINDPTSSIQNVIVLKPLLDDSEQHEFDKFFRDSNLNDGIRIDAVSLIYNPAQDDIVPVKGDFKQFELNRIIDDINNDLVPHSLPPIKENGKISGIVIDNNQKQAIGIINTMNEIEKFATPIPFTGEPNFVNTLPLNSQSSPTDTDGDAVSDTVSDTDSSQSSPSDTDSAQSSPSDTASDTGSAQSSPSDTASDTVSTQSSPTDTVSDTDSAQSTPSDTDSDTVSDTDSTQSSESNTDSIQSSDTDSAQSSPSDTVSDTPLTVGLNDQALPLDNVPVVDVSQDVTNTLQSEIDAAKTTAIDKEQLLDEFDCAKGSVFDVNEQRCIACEQYNLVWDAEFKKCKLAIKRLMLVVDEENNILGRT